MGVDHAELPAAAPPYLGPTGKDFVPFGVGYIELGDVKVEARLTSADPEVLEHGMDDGAACWCRSAPTTTATTS